MTDLSGWTRSLAGQREPDLADQVRGFFMGLLVFQVAIQALAALAAHGFVQGALFLGMNLTLSTAAGLIGAVLGFVFGIPRALTADPPANGAAAGGPKSRPNTNLEQISDWLTKILVGASLTSLTLIPGFVGRLAAALDKGPYGEMPGHGTLAVFIILAFLPLGFFWSYVETRTLITKLFGLFDGLDAQVTPDLMLAVRSAPADPGTPPIPEDAAVLGLKEDALTNAALLEARAAAETRHGDLKAARGHYEAALKLDPGNPRLALRLSAVLARLGEPEQAAQYTSKVEAASGANVAQQNLVSALKVGNALYKPAPAGFTEAITTGEPLLAGDQANNGQLHLWLACAYGQKVAFAYKDRKAVPSTDPDRMAALKRLRDVKRLRPDLMDLARRLWKPDVYGGDPKENDLEVFRDDDEFAAVLTG